MTLAQFVIIASLNQAANIGQIISTLMAVLQFAVWLRRPVHRLAAKLRTNATLRWQTISALLFLIATCFAWMIGGSSPIQLAQTLPRSTIQAATTASSQIRQFPSFPIGQPAAKTTVSYVGLVSGTPPILDPEYIFVRGRNYKPNEPVTFWVTFPDQTAHYLTTVAADAGGGASTLIPLRPRLVNYLDAKQLLGNVGNFGISYPAGVLGPMPVGEHYFSARGDASARRATAPFLIYADSP